ncbi:MAG: TPM domain-containing protein [Bacteriovoracaceae bacterium]
MLLNEQNLKNLDLKIKNFEENTKGEIRLAVLTSSDPYPGANYRLSFTLSFLFTALIEIFFPLGGEQALLLVLAFLLLNFFCAPYLPFRSLFILPSEKEREVKEKAMTLFCTQGLANTQNRIGILLFISALEKKIELIVDQTILQKLGQETLDQIVKEITAYFKKSEYEAGLVAALAHLEKELLVAFPQGLQEKLQDELSNKIILD